MRYFIKTAFSAMLMTAILLGGYRLAMPRDREESLSVMGRPGDSGEETVLLQTRLLEYGYEIEISGIYDLATSSAVRRFQEDRGIDVSGVANAETLYRLGIPVDPDELCLYEERRFLASVLDAVCPEATYLTKVAMAGMILKRQADTGFPDELPAVVFGEPAFAEAYLHDFSIEPSAEAWRAARDAASGMSPCPNALYFYRKGNGNDLLKELVVVFKNGSYIFAAPPAE